MATGLQIEELTRDLASGKPVNQRNSILTSLQNLGGNLSNLKALKALLDTVVADAGAAGKNDYAREQVQADWGANLASVVGASFIYAGKTGINAIAQLIADLSEQAGMDGTANEIRIYKNGVVVPVSQDA